MLDEDLAHGQSLKRNPDDFELTSWSAKLCHWWTLAFSLRSEGRMVWFGPSSATDQVSSWPDSF